MIDPGKLRERVTIQKPVERRSSIGETTLTWEDFTERWASVESLSAREFLLQGQQRTEITHRVRLRRVEGFTSVMRIVWRDRTFEIISLIDQNNRSEHEVLCVERVE